jgi:hypothetical protein
MMPDSANALVQLTGPSEDMQEHHDLEGEAGFGNRQVLGELVYAYVVCCLDIAFAVTLLSRFASTPAPNGYRGTRLGHSA